MQCFSPITGPLPLCPKRNTVRMCANDGQRVKVSRPVQYHGIQHAGMLVENTERAKKFYTEVFGMEDETHSRNPKLPFKGAFMRAGNSQIHLMELPSPDPIEGRPDHGGRYVSLSL